MHLEKLLKVDTSTFHSKTKAYLKRLIKHQESILTFLHQEDLPFDNNVSERAIRNVKVKNNVSGSFRSQQVA